MKCEWCCEHVSKNEAAYWPEDVPEDIHVPDKTDFMTYHKWCFEAVIADERQNQFMKHAPDNMEVA